MALKSAWDLSFDDATIYILPSKLEADEDAGKLSKVSTI